MRVETLAQKRELTLIANYLSSSNSCTARLSDDFQNEVFEQSLRHLAKLRKLQLASYNRAYYPTQIHLTGENRPVNNTVLADSYEAGVLFYLYSDCLDRVWRSGDGVHYPAYLEFYGIPTDKPYYSRPDAREVAKMEAFYYLREDPYETTQDGVTYRVLIQPGYGQRAELVGIFTPDDPVYNYLDKGHCLFSIFSRQHHRFVAVEKMTFETFKAMIGLKLFPKMAEELDVTFLTTQNARVVSRKVERKCKGHKLYSVYRLFEKTIVEHYRSNSANLLCNKLQTGQVETAKFNDIQMTQTSAVFETVSIQADNLLEQVTRNLSLTAEFDIYDVIRAYADRAVGCADEAESDEDFVFPTFRINDIAINFTRNKLGVNRLNGTRINKAEIADCIYRASCHRCHNEYMYFLKEVSKLSLERHSILSMGMPVKIHTMSSSELNSSTPSRRAPVLKFKKFGHNDIHLVYTEDGRCTKVDLTKLIKRVKSINSTTSRRYYNRRHFYDRSELNQAVLKDAIQETTNNALDADQASFLIKQAQDEKQKALEKSKEYLEKIVKMTGAETTQYNGEAAFKVKGSLREYIVEKETGKVYNAETNTYICIVNDQHYQGVGYDQVADRLLALKNDAASQEEISTIQKKEEAA